MAAGNPQIALRNLSFSKKKSQSFIQSTRQLVPTFERASIDSRSTGPPFQFEQSDRRYARPDQLPDYLAGANFEK